MAHNLICYLHILRTFLCSSIHFCMHARLTADLIWYRWWVWCVRVSVSTYGKHVFYLNMIRKFLFVACFLSYFPVCVTCIVCVCICARSVARLLASSLTYVWLLNSWHATFCPHSLTPLPTLSCSSSLHILLASLYNNIRLTCTRKSARNIWSKHVLQNVTMRCEPFSHILIRLLLIK